MSQSSVDEQLPSKFVRFVEDVRESWHRTPFLHRMLSFTILLFSLLAICFIVLLVDDAKRYMEKQNLQDIPGILRPLSEIVTSLSVESEATAAFITSATTANWNAVLNARADTNSAEEVARSQFAMHQASLLLASDFALQTGTLLTESGIDALEDLRANVQMQQITLSPQLAREAYARLAGRVMQLFVKFAATMNSGTVVEKVLVAESLTAYQWHISAARRALRNFLQQTSSTPVSVVRSSLINSVQELQRLSMVQFYLLAPIQDEAERRQFDLELASATIRRQAAVLIAASTAGMPYDSSVAIPVTVDLAQLRTLLRHMQNALIVDLEKPDASFFARSLVMSIVAVLAILGSIIQWAVFEYMNAERNSLQIRNANVMHDVLVRVGEFVEHMSSFTLDPPPPPRSMMGTRVGVIELRMQHCLASLKALAPTLPPLLFPKRLALLAADYSCVRDPSTMQFTKKPRDSLMKEPLLRVTAEDVEFKNQFLVNMQKLTSLQVTTVKAAFLFLDLSFFHEMNTVEKMQFSSDYFKEVVSLLEECVFQFDGVLHSVSLDRAVAVWNIANPRPNFCEQAATCGLVLASRLGGLRRHHPTLQQFFQQRIGVVAGSVRYGVFGSQMAKFLELFGEPLTKGISVARANSFHMTTVACDETVRRATEKIYLAKPIELLEDGSRIYEVIHEGSRKETDLETQLMVYSKAFELFERKYYREALRSFRAYTKLYGYDSSVERIQAIITGM